MWRFHIVQSVFVSTPVWPRCHCCRCYSVLCRWPLSCSSPPPAGVPGLVNPIMKPFTKDSVCITLDPPVMSMTLNCSHTMCTLTFATLVGLRHIHLMSLIQIEQVMVLKWEVSSCVRSDSAAVCGSLCGGRLGSRHMSSGFCTVLWDNIWEQWVRGGVVWGDAWEG